MYKMNLGHSTILKTKDVIKGLLESKGPEQPRRSFHTFPPKTRTIWEKTKSAMDSSLKLWVQKKILKKILGHLWKLLGHKTNYFGNNNRKDSHLSCPFCTNYTISCQAGLWGKLFFIDRLQPNKYQKKWQKNNHHFQPLVTKDHQCQNHWMLLKNFLMAPTG